MQFRFPREILCAVIAGATTFWVGAMQFIPIYHVFHDMFHVPTECCTLAFLGLYAYLVWIADRNPQRDARPHGSNHILLIASLQLCLLIVPLFCCNSLQQILVRRTFSGCNYALLFLHGLGASCRPGQYCKHGTT